MVTNSSALRMQSDVRLVVPEVDPGHIEMLECQAWRRNAKGLWWPLTPNCSAIGLVVALAPLQQFGIETVIAVTMRAVAAPDIPEWPRSTFWAT